ncbi:MAG: YgiT-type zinc finger protein [Caldilineaceae bacterium]|nr:YgiT-type zinc finger protein [Caldilineaceae bacterium]
MKSIEKVREQLAKGEFEFSHHAVVEHIPAIVCEQCGEKIFSREVTEKVRELLHSEQEPIRTVEVDVFDLAQV